MTHWGSCLVAKGGKPVVKFQHKFKATYVYGSFSPINGDSYVCELPTVNKQLFQQYLTDFSNYSPTEFKIIVMDNAGFHSLKDFKVPDNIYLLNIPPYSPELNPAEQIWKHMKSQFKLQSFDNLLQLKQWIYNTCYNLKESTIKSITSNHHYLNNFKHIF